MKIDEKYMRRALQIARRGAGNTSPNPMVGAVVVCDDEIIGEGYHRRFGEGHAEVNAIASVCDKSRLCNSTIYVTLEPCSHYGKTPPCSELILRMGVPRVVVGSLDPFEQVSGRGVQMLRDGGVEVEVGVLEDECKALNCAFIHAHTIKRPYILLKWAQTADGFIGVNGERMHISLEATQTQMHRLRSCYDAILIGANTLRSDNPSLTVRKYIGRNPIRVVLTHNLENIPFGNNLFTDAEAKTIVYVIGSVVTVTNIQNVEFVEVDSLEYMLSDLYSRNIISLMVEGGANVLEQFIYLGLWDECRVEVSRKSLKEYTVRTTAEAITAPILKQAQLINIEQVEANSIALYRHVR